MGMFLVKCEQCGANLHVADEAEFVNCEYCGHKTMLKEFNSRQSIIDQPNNNVISQNNNIQNNNMTSNNIQNNNSFNQNNTIKPKKKKNNSKKIFLYVFFSIIIIASAIVFYLDYTKKPEEPEIYDHLPSEILINDEEKQEVQVESNIIKMAPDVDLDAERKKYNNNEIVGRLEIPDLFNVLVAKTDNNQYYLSHSIKKESDIRGTEFLDFRLTTKSKQLNIYGHNTRDENIKVAFLKLEKFLKKDFFDENQYIIFQHDGGKNIYKIVSIKEIRETNNEHMYVDYTGQEFVEHVKKMTTGEGVNNYRDVHYDENSEIIVLQTCSHHWDNAFYIVVGVKI